MNKAHLPDLTVPAKDVMPKSNLSLFSARTTGKAVRERAPTPTNSPRPYMPRFTISSVPANAGLFGVFVLVFFF